MAGSPTSPGPVSVGTATANPLGAQQTSTPALKSIATNQALLMQNLSKLAQTLSVITKAWGA